MKRRRESFLVFGSPLIGDAELDEVLATLRSGWVGTGPRVHEFERRMAEYAGVKHALAVSSCTAALHLSLLAIGLKPGDEVITTPMTFVATANAIVHAGGKPVFVDVDRDTMLMDPRNIEAALTPRTKAILPVHLTGRSCDMDAILSIAARRGLRVIGDAAHSIEGEYKGRRIGSVGDMACLSFYVTKNLTTIEGGMVLTDNEEWVDRMRILSLHGMSKDAYKRFSDQGYKHYEVIDAGYKYNMTDLQAAIGLQQMKRLDSSWDRRDAIWARYQKELAGLPLHLPAPDEARTKHARHLYTVLLDSRGTALTRDEVLDGLTERGIGAGVHYTALHLQPYYRKNFGFKDGDFPNAEWIGSRTLSLPLSAKLTDDDVTDVVAALRDIFGV